MYASRKKHFNSIIIHNVIQLRSSIDSVKSPLGVKGKLTDNLGVNDMA